MRQTVYYYIVVVCYVVPLDDYLLVSGRHKLVHFQYANARDTFSFSAENYRMGRIAIPKISNQIKRF